jgi:hypothetical protein
MTLVNYTGLTGKNISVTQVIYCSSSRKYQICESVKYIQKDDDIFRPVKGQPQSQQYGLAGKTADEIFSNFRGILHG